MDINEHICYSRPAPFIRSCGRQADGHIRPEGGTIMPKGQEDWCSSISEDDTVILPGDISWGLKLESAKYDLDWVDALPGRKIITKGNHDLWWSGITKLNKMYETVTFLQNGCCVAEGVYICGTRGWLTPDNDDFGEDDERIYKREMLRLRASLDKAVKMAADAEKSRTYSACCIIRRYRSRRRFRGSSRYSMITV